MIDEKALSLAARALEKHADDSERFGSWHAGAFEVWVQEGARKVIEAYHAAQEFAAKRAGSMKD